MVSLTKLGRGASSVTGEARPSFAIRRIDYRRRSRLDGSIAEL